MTEPNLVLAELARLKDDGPSPLAMPQRRPSSPARARKRGQRGKSRPTDSGPEDRLQSHPEGWHEARPVKGGSVRMHRGNRLTVGRWHALKARPAPLRLSTVDDYGAGLVEWVP